jgi:HEAT repeat protein
MIMKTNLCMVLIAALLAGSILCTSADEEQDLIAVLKSNAGAAEKSAACVRLRVVGTAAAVPALAPLLLDESTAHAARYVLEAIPSPESSTALRAALERSSGLLKAGLLDSLGAIKDSDSVPLVAPLLSEPQPAISASAARALGSIRTPDAIAALIENNSHAAHEALLACADALRSDGGAQGALPIYAHLSNEGSAAIRQAAWRGLVLSAQDRNRLILDALLGKDDARQKIALKLVHELQDPALIEHCAQAWERLPSHAQLALLNARSANGGDALPPAMRASRSEHPSVRMAAWNALAKTEAAAAIPLLAEAAGHGEPAERTAAYDALCQMGGPSVPEAIVNALASATASARTELIRALGDRRDADAGPVLLKHATREHPEPLRLAALESLRKIGSHETLAPLMTLAADCTSEAECEPVMRTLEGICRTAADKNLAAQAVIDRINRGNPEFRRQLLALLPDLGTGSALETLDKATECGNPNEAAEAIRALARWPTSAPAAKLLAVARDGSNSTLRVLAVRASIELAGLEADSAKRLSLLKQAMAAAQRPPEKKQAVSALAAVTTLEALQFAETTLDDAAVAEEAALAAISIAERLTAAHPEHARRIAERLLAESDSTEVLGRAWKLHGKPQPGPFIRRWSAAGPFSKIGAAGAAALFEAPFPPESDPAATQWAALPESDQVNLAAIFPGRDNAAAYIRSRILAPADCKAVLLLGSDDGVKAWLNGTVVHSNNVDRGDIPDQDVALIQLTKGRNDLLLKISQGGGGWSAHARIVGLDGKPISGLRDER